ncbi:dolichyl pyrophosphate Glc1Man9GlcNAc2 alpha-1,3-glucosyltransferase-like isoform X3 [Oscarella lobularis]|uniref:dolichyl pyrophosphate Glc1Man9GlcNAc2 alpha-1,3-glucosyltransferase-like isoform X3 n=1 Tax=Oscarella lobularis TaxID=121494 RepID=UPI00331419AE
MIDKPWLTIVAIASALKLLFIPAYRSTDFEVHRNWLAITHSLPIDRWYYESTSEWTLDYPPFFAWFEWLLSIVASRVDPAMLVVSNLNYASNACIVFQRVSVIVADFVLAFATRTYCSTLGVASSRRAFTLAVLILLNAGLLIVDHIHFQYNGLLLGLLLLSIARLKQERVLEGAFWFAVLLNMKHIFLYVAPAYILYLFRSYCFQDTQRQTGWLPRFSTFLPSRLLRLGAIVTAVFAVSFGPFIAMGQLPQVMSRLFPLKRGLTHAYWAPNVWALYNFADKTTSMLTRSASSRPSTTGGLVGDVEHVVLPSVPPIAALLLTTVSILPGLVASWRRPGNFRLFLRGLVACAYGSFLFGWHVHEKAILLVIVPLRYEPLGRRERRRCAQLSRFVYYRYRFALSSSYSCRRDSHQGGTVFGLLSLFERHSSLPFPRRGESRRRARKIRRHQRPLDDPTHHLESTVPVWLGAFRVLLHARLPVH